MSENKINPADVHAGIEAQKQQIVDEASEALDTVYTVDYLELIAQQKNDTVGNVHMLRHKTGF